VNVDGIDLSANMIRIAIARLKEEGLESLVNLKLKNCLELNDEAIYDLVHSRDVFLHVKNKDLLFEVTLNAIVSGGRLCFSDYCLGQTKPSAEFNTYLRYRNYSLLTVPDYTKILEKAGFKNVHAEDRTEHFIEILKHELLHLENSSLKEHEKYSLRDSWMDKIKRSDNGEQSWAWFYGEKL
ncbi:MAG: methyltransferase domain-containing protein, partial [SAR324 cluster bacterium]|nr:methyltransferase domain-containing protein [SAR324 cluster bacterium]